MINIAIDGPSGGGKSTLAKKIAKELGYIYVDTGALYRSVALYMQRGGVNVQDRAAVIAALPGVAITMKHEGGTQQVYLGDEMVGDAIRTPEISQIASLISPIPEVRAFLLSLQMEIAERENVVMDGRDIGTVILPKAQVKIFLSASNQTRAMRRYKELTEKGIQTTYEEILAAMNQRDEQDRNRETAPAIAAPDAVLLDNSELDPEQTLQAALEIIRSKLG